MTTKSRILVCSDPLMTKSSEQASNNRWLLDLLQRPIERATGIKPQSFLSQDTEGDGLIRTKFFDLSGIESDSAATQFWFNSEAVTQKSLDYLGQHLKQSDLVVGYELSEQTRALLNRLSVPYVDMWLHQIRFMDDVLFGFNSNNPGIRGKLFNFDLPEDQMYLYADRVRIQTYRGWRRVEADLLENSALFVGQMLNDKSVCANGKMLNLLDFKERVEDVAQKYSRIYYARHPYLSEGDEEILRFVERHPNIELTDIPSYRMLSNPNLAHVFGVSSSVIQEAKYFGKSTEYLFKPALTYGDKAAPESYATVFQEFVSPHFWADILSPIMLTQDSPKVLFQDPKDKIRDMLGFYWSYADIDKTEHTRQRVNHSLRPASPKKPQHLVQPAKTWKAPEGFYQTDAQIDALNAKIDAHSVISFDIFDTLIERTVNWPGDLHPIMALQTPQITGGKIEDFLAARREARNLALDKANGEEVLLKDRYQAMAHHYGLTPEQGEELHQLELKLELEVCKPRFAGVQALERAVKSGKRVILVSDIFFERDFILALLKSCGITGYDRIYLSSEEGVLKQTGRLFDVVLKEEGVKPKKILHLGDNVKSDIEMGLTRDLSVFHLPEKRVIAERSSPAICAMKHISDADTRSLVTGLASRRFTQSALPEFPGNSGGKTDFLGYGIAGPMFWGFARWIAENARSQGLTDLYFLARDGDIAKRCYDIITQDDPNAPRSHYVLASRRAVNVARIHSKEDILHNLETNFTPCSFETLLMNRFGVEAELIDEAVFKRFGYDSMHDKANRNTHRDRVLGLVTSDEVSALILKNAAKERELLMANYRAHGLDDPTRKIGFIDIGHSGTLQSAICKIMGIANSVGYYFATKDDIDANLGPNHNSHGYVVDRIDHKDAGHPYQKHILMFELLFQNKDGSFLCFSDDTGRVVPQFIDLPSEQPRIEFIKTVHAGVLEFVRDMEKACAALSLKPQLTGSEAILPYSQMLKAPWPADVALFDQIGFENKYSARDIRWIIAPEGDDSAPSLWVEGGEAIRKPLPPRASSAISIPVEFITPFIRSERLNRKLRRDPEAFFADSKKPLVRMVGKFVS
ncbi:hypothetical protein J7382_17830 [Shimia sp. R11_0]|uniref:HAD family hydrolase n=1 Tax=Shimia sp. R11_0 TaxID=2821096 RepID=UPI001ADA4DC6|nr:HAD family hydrolase [Shimia sp. R11_0]MBO9479409.1 hypothetical protein [Shimia sp. R11_0]